MKVSIYISFPDEIKTILKTHNKTWPHLFDAILKYIGYIPYNIHYWRVNLLNSKITMLAYFKIDEEDEIFFRLTYPTGEISIRGSDLLPYMIESNVSTIEEVLRQFDLSLTD